MKTRVRPIVFKLAAVKEFYFLLGPFWWRQVLTRHQILTVSYTGCAFCASNCHKKYFTIFSISTQNAIIMLLKKHLFFGIEIDFSKLLHFQQAQWLCRLHVSHNNIKLIMSLGAKLNLTDDAQIIIKTTFGKISPIHQAS